MELPAPELDRIGDPERLVSDLEKIRCPKHGLHARIWWSPGVIHVEHSCSQALGEKIEARIQKLALHPRNPAMP